MKLLHLADLHIGKRVHEFSMLSEQKHVLWQILDYVKQYKPDGVLIAGDVYDRSVPGVEAVRLFDTFLAELHQTGTKVFLISGNHDSAERIQFAGDILEESGVYLAGSCEDELKHVTLQDEYGEVVIWLLPFMKSAVVSDYLNRNFSEKARHVLVAHQFVTWNGKAEESDSEYHSIGGLDEIDVSLFQEFDYVALGHLHGAQKIGRETVRYAGSPLKYSFSEVHQKKSVTLVELKEKGVTEIRQLLLTPIHDMRKIKGPLAALLSKEVVEAAPADDYIHATLTDEEELYDAVGQLRDKYPNLMRLEFENSRTKAVQETDGKSAQWKDASPFQFFLEFYEQQNGVPMSEEEESLLKQFLTEGGELD